jgi:hypothetical protein
VLVGLGGGAWWMHRRRRRLVGVGLGLERLRRRRYTHRRVGVGHAHDGCRRRRRLVLHRRDDGSEAIRHVEHAAWLPAVHLADLVRRRLRLLGPRGGRAGEDVRERDDNLADVAVAEDALRAEQHVEARPRRGLGGGRDGEPERGVPPRVPAAGGVRRRALTRQRVARDGHHRVHVHAGDQVHVLELSRGYQGHLQLPVRHA